LSKRERNTTTIPKKVNSIYSENRKASNGKFTYELNKGTMNVTENRNFKIHIFKNKKKAYREIEISTSCDKKITVYDFLINIIKTYNNLEVIEQVDLINAKLLLSSKYQIFDKFLNEHEEIQEQLYEIHQTKNKQLSVVILDNDEIIDFEDFLKKGSNSKQYFNINFPGHSETIPPCFTTLNINSSNTFEEKTLVNNLQKFLKENYNMEVEKSKMFFIRIDECVYKSIYTDISNSAIDEYYLRILQKDNKNNFIKIYIKE